MEIFWYGAQDRLLEAVDNEQRMTHDTAWTKYRSQASAGGADEYLIMNPFGAVGGETRISHVYAGGSCCPSRSRLMPGNLVEPV